MQSESELHAEMERLLAPPTDDVEEGRTPTPVTVLTGFLGAGKTFANRPLSEDHGLRIAVLINDFGDVDIDSELIVGITSNQISLANGCVCCEIRDDLITAIDSVLAADNQIDAIVLEASGVVEPLSIARTFVDASLPQSPPTRRHHRGCRCRTAPRPGPGSGHGRYTIDTHHTPGYAAGYLAKRANPRLFMTTHMPFDPYINEETVAEVRSHRKDQRLSLRKCSPPSSSQPSFTDPIDTH
jgi:hypothetical protein